MYNKIKALFERLSVQERGYIFGDGQFHIDENEDGEWIVRLDETERVIAAGFFKKCKEPENSYSITIFIDPEHRRLGLGRSIIQTFFRRHGRSSIPLFGNRSNGATLFAKINKENVASYNMFNKHTDIYEKSLYDENQFAIRCVEKDTLGRIDNLEDEILEIKKQLNKLTNNK